jgi:hypothetical protein
MYITIKKNRTANASALAEFAPGLAFLIFAFLVSASISSFLAVQLALKSACVNAACRAGDCSTAQQASQVVTALDYRFRKGSVGLLLDDKFNSDGMSFVIDRTSSSNNSLFCHVAGHYHVRMLFCPWLVEASSDATSVVEHPEGYGNVSQRP